MYKKQTSLSSGAAGLAALVALIEETFPLPRRFRAGLPACVAELSRLLTSARPERDGGYLGRPQMLSAYLRYFLPWNVFRLHSLFSLDAVPLPALSDGDAVTDLGSGPLTLPIALWLARPELRKLRLEFRCIDHTGAALDAGKKLFFSLTEKIKMPQAGLAGGSPLSSDLTTRSGWIIKTIRGPLDTPVYGARAKLVSAVNVFNEVYRHGPPGEGAEQAAALLDSLCTPDGTVFTAEPGNPRGGAFIAGLRSALRERGRVPLAPCPHDGACPLPGGALPFDTAGTAAAYGEAGRRRVGGTGGGKAKWCHFAFDTESAPEALHRLSAAADIPKERATVSFLLAGPAAVLSGDVKRMRDNTPSTDRGRIRVISDAFPVFRAASGQWGRYGCSERGLVLVTGDRREMEKAVSGSLLELPFPHGGKRDPKTGALVIWPNAGSVTVAP